MAMPRMSAKEVGSGTAVTFMAEKPEDPEFEMLIGIDPSAIKSVKIVI